MTLDKMMSFHARLVIVLGILTTPAFAQKAEVQTTQDQYQVVYDDRVLWTNPISVCWENGQEFPTETGWVQEKIQQEYTGRINTINFVGWGVCNASSQGIRIKIDDSGPHTIGLGRQLAGQQNGMILNFTFENWSPSCQSFRQHCIEIIAVHEFGHAIGLAHEQNRLDTFGVNTFNACSDAPQGGSGNRTIGPWDPDSAMNYCNELWNNNGKLSAWDVEGISRLYGGTGRVADLGYFQPPRAMIDVNGDAFKDYCRIVGNAPNRFISCKLTDANGFTNGDEYSYSSSKGIDLGYESLPRYFADVNGDRQPDYCRFVGDEPNIFLSCDLGTNTGFSQNQYEFSSIKGIDQGYDSFRALVDVNRDRRADYCRFVGDGSNIYLSCNLATSSGFAPEQYGFNSVKGIDRGYDGLPRTLLDKNRDGRADYCRYVGNKPTIHLSCNTATPTGFAGNQYTLDTNPDPTASYNK